VFRSNIASLSNNERKVDFKRRRYIQTKNKNKNQNNKASKKQNKKTPKAKQNMAYEKFEGTKRVIGRLKSKKDIQYNE
jgi:hypothetical protein